jgi:hypothetical protein
MMNSCWLVGTLLLLTASELLRSLSASLGVYLGLFVAICGISGKALKRTLEIVFVLVCLCFANQSSETSSSSA